MRELSIRELECVDGASSAGNAVADFVISVGEALYNALSAVNEAYNNAR